MAKNFRIEVYRQNPSLFVTFNPDNLIDNQVVDDASVGKILVRNFHKQGYWVETYDNHSNELIDGPIDPDAPLPPGLFLR